jgi:hypothetical protein
MRRKISTHAFFKHTINNDSFNQVAERNYHDDLSNFYNYNQNVDTFKDMNEKAELIKESIETFFHKYKELKLIKKESNQTVGYNSRNISKNNSKTKIHGIIFNENLKIKSKVIKTLEPKRTQSSIQLKNLMTAKLSSFNFNNNNSKKDNNPNKFLERKRSISMKNLTSIKGNNNFGLQFDQTKVKIGSNDSLSLVRNKNAEDLSNKSLHSHNKLKSQIKLGNKSVKSVSEKSSHKKHNESIYFHKSLGSSVENHNIAIKNNQEYSNSLLSLSPETPLKDPKRDSFNVRSILRKHKESMENEPNSVSSDYYINHDNSFNAYRKHNNNNNYKNKNNNNNSSKSDYSKSKSVSEIEDNEDRVVKDHAKTDKRALFKKKKTMNASNINYEDKSKIELFMNGNNDCRSLYIINKVYDSLSDDENQLNFEDYDYLIHPDSPFKQGLDFAYILIIFLFTLSIPINLTMQFNNSSYFKVVDIISDFIILTSIISMFFTPYMNDSLQLIFDKKLISKKYLGGGFTLDLISLIPFNTIFNFISLGNSYLQMLRLVRLIKFFALNDLNYTLVKKIFFVKYFKNKLITKSNKYGIILQFFRFLLNFSISIHVSSCIFIFLGKMNPRNNWIIHRELQDSKFGTIYMAAIYFHFVTIFTVGYGDIIAKTVPEYVFNSLFLMVGIGVYSLTISFLSKFSIDDAKTKVINKNLDYLSFLDYNFSIPRKIYSKTLRLIKNDDEVIRKEKISLLEELPTNLKHELIIQSHREVFENFKFFKNLGNKKEFISKVIQVMKPAIGYKSEILIEENQIVEETIFIKQGVLSLDVCYKNINLSVICIRRNEHFGDSLMMLHKPSPVAARVKSKFIEIYLLRKFDFIFILFDYPIIFDTIFEKGTRNLMILEKEIDIKKRIIDNMHPDDEFKQFQPSNSMSSFDYFSNPNNFSNKKSMKKLQSDLSVVDENPSENNINYLNNMSSKDKLNNKFNSSIIENNKDSIKNSINELNNKSYDIKNNYNNNFTNNGLRMISPTSKAKSFNNPNFLIDLKSFNEENNSKIFKQIKNGEYNNNHDNDKSQMYNSNKLTALEKLSNCKNDKNIKQINSENKKAKNTSYKQSISIMTKNDSDRTKGKGKNILMKQLNINMENSTHQLLDSQNYFSEYFQNILNQKTQLVNKDVENRLDKLALKLKKTITQDKIQL